MLGGSRVGFAEGFIGKGTGPADHDEKYIEDKERDGDVVEEHGLGNIGPELIGCPEEEGDREKDRLENLQPSGAVSGLVGEVGNGDHGEWKRAKNIVGFGRKEARSSVPGQQYGDAGKGDEAENDRESPMCPIKANVHTTLLSRHSKRRHKDA